MRGSRRRRAFTCSLTRSSACGSARAGRASASKWPGTWLPGHKTYLADIERSLQRAGLAGDFAYRGAVDRDGKLAFLRDLDVLSVPATYDEPKGIFLLEAMASGVPVVQPRRGGFTEIVERTGGGLLVEPDNVESLTEGLHTLWRDPALRGTLARQGYDGVRAQYTVQRATDRVAGGVRRGDPREAFAGRESRLELNHPRSDRRVC